MSVSERPRPVRAAITITASAIARKISRANGTSLTVPWPISVNAEGNPNGGDAPATEVAMLVTMNWVASVTSRESIPAKATMRPLNRPKSVLTAIAATMASAGLPPLASTVPAMTAARLALAPQERSMLPVRITMASPSARTPVGANCSVRLSMPVPCPANCRVVSVK